MIMDWTGAHCVFVVEMFFKTGEFVIASQSFFLGGARGVIVIIDLSSNPGWGWLHFH